MFSALSRKGAGVQAGDPRIRLSLLAKLAAVQAVAPPPAPADPLEYLAWVESSEPFEQAGVPGFLEGIPSDSGRASAEDVEEILALVRSCASEPLGTLYMKLMPRSWRHARGEYYTPAWLAELVLDRAGFCVEGSGRDSEMPRLLDPMCGAGVFLITALARLRRRRPDLSATEMARSVRGMDVSPLAVLMARSAYLAAVGTDRLCEPIRIPVACADAILHPPAGERFDIIAGNPPWIGWESLPPEYRRKTRPLWHHHGLFPDRGRQDGMQVMLGRGKKDLAMLATYMAAENLLGPAGRLSFVITRTVFKSVGSGAGFRRFRLGDGTPLRVTGVDDLSARSVFPTAGARATILTMRKGESTRYPVPYAVWGRGGSAEVREVAEPVDSADPTSAWLTGSPARIRSLRHVIGPSAYRARAGAYTGGANGVFWVRVLDGGGAGSAGVCQVANLPLAGKRRVACLTAPVERDLIFPLLRASQVRRLQAEPSLSILLPQDPSRRRGIDESIMAERYPLALQYLRGFADALSARRDRGTRSLVEAGAPFYSIFSVSMDTLAPWKVVWPRISSRVTAAAVGPRDGRPVIPQETCTFIACAGEEEACYLAGILSSSLFNEAAGAFGQVGGKGFGGPHLLRHIAVPRYDRTSPTHSRLAELTREQGPSVTQDDLDAAAEPAWAER